MYNVLIKLNPYSEDMETRYPTHFERKAPMFLGCNETAAAAKRTATKVANMFRLDGVLQIQQEMRYGDDVVISERHTNRGAKWTVGVDFS